MRVRLAVEGDMTDDGARARQWRFVLRATWLKPQVRIATVQPGQFCQLRFTVKRKPR
jgi:hypothetical protein